VDKTWLRMIFSIELALLLWLLKKTIMNITWRQNQCHTTHTKRLVLRCFYFNNGDITDSFCRSSIYTNIKRVYVNQCLILFELYICIQIIFIDCV
jgi:hypothetical protein